MDELNQTNESAVEEVSAAESEKALNCDSCGPKKTKTPAMFKAGIALMCATSALSLGAIGACGFLGYKLYKNTKIIMNQIQRIQCKNLLRIVKKL